MTASSGNSDVSQFKAELDEALSALDLALLEAGRSVSIVRNSLTRVFELAEYAGEMEAAIVRAREQLALTFPMDSAAPSLRAVPAQGEQVSDSEPVQKPERDAIEDVVENVRAQLLREERAEPATNVEQVSHSKPVQEPEGDARKDVVKNLRAQLLREERAEPATNVEQVSHSKPVQEPEDDARKDVVKNLRAQLLREERAEPATNVEQVSDSEPVQEPEDDAMEDVAEKPRAQLPRVEPAEPATNATRCLRLKVNKKSGSLDLKDVDRAVNENSAVMDVALLDYDGRQATLKLWVNERADPSGVREALLTSLRAHLGEEETELAIDFEEDSAA